MTQERPTIESLQNQVRKLTRGLNSAKQQLESVTAERLSTARELKIVVEQIEASREQLTAANREMLYTRNEITEVREQLRQVKIDLEELLSCIDIPIVMVGRDLRIRRFTKGASTALKLSASHLGRPLHEATSISNLDQLLTDLTYRLESQEREILTSDGRRFLLRIKPYHADNTAEGLVMMLSET